MTSYTLSDQAYAKIFFHSAKYPHRPVNGVLLGTQSNSSSVHIEDCIPLLHHWTNLSPTMEIGLDLATIHAASRELSIVGYYHASDKVNETSLTPVGEKVMGWIRAQFSQAVAFVVNGEELASGLPALIPYLPSSDNGSYRRDASVPDAFSTGSRFSLASPDISSRALDGVQKAHMHQKLGDFDDHLENVSVDWLRNKSCMTTFSS